MKINQNKNWFIYVIGVLVVGFLLMLNSVTADNLSQELKSAGSSGGYTEYTPHLSLPKGEYTFTCSGGGEFVVTNPEGKEFGEGKGTATVKLDKDESNIIVKTKSGTVSNVKIESKHAIFSDTAVVTLLIILLLLYLGYIRFKKQGELTRSAINVTLIMVAVFASYPLFSNYISYGQDLNFHLYRIEGLKDGLLSGQFPVRIDPTHNKGYGYITASVYPSLFLYFPALLRIMGVSSVTAYKIFLFAINLATAFIMYGCTKKITKSGFAGVFASVVYTLSTWRIVNLIYRAAIGEALAMTFFPVVILGLYCILKGDKSKWWIFALGCSAVFHSHVISCVFVAMLSIVTIVVFIRDFLRDKRWFAFIKSIILTVLLNLWYLIPFMKYYFGVDLAIRHTAVNTEYFSNAIFPAEMFNFFNDKFGYSLLMPIGIKGNMSLSLGVGVTICFVIAALYFAFERKNKIKDNSFHAEMFLFAVFIMFMASTLFPSELLQKPKLLNMLAGTIRMPWRFLSLASPIICIVAAAVVLSRISSANAKKITIGVTCLVCAFSFVFFGTAYTTSYDASLKKGQTVGTDGSPGWDNEYFIYGTNVNALEPEKYNTSDSSLEVKSYDKNGTNISLELSGAKSGEYVEVPLLYYPGYSAKDGNGSRLEVVCGNNNVLRVNINDGTDTVKIKYSGFWSFKIGCIISALTVIGLILLWLYRRREEQKC